MMAMNIGKNRLTIAFESGRLSYSHQEIDLHNSGINQILSIAAIRGHSLCHFRMHDLYLKDNIAYARCSILALNDYWYGNPSESYLHLQKVDEHPVPLNEIDLCFFRADDVRHSGTPNLNLVRTIEEHGILLEGVMATLSTNDKYEIVRRVPDVPRPVTFTAGLLDEALEALDRLPKSEGYFVLKDRYGYGCGHDVHRLEFADPELKEIITTYLAAYDQVILQEYCPEVDQGDLVVTFFDGEQLAAIHRQAAFGEWKTNLSLGATQYPYKLNREQARIARMVQLSFPECRFLSVDMFPSGKVLEVNAFPGGRGLLELYGLSAGSMIMNRLEKELLVDSIIDIGT
jgi:glutathione synthase/RimK-type ligase-like ATP-grasp enzyme